MKNVFLFLTLIVVLKIAAQPSISGTFTPTENFTWVLAYQLTPESQEYVGNTEIMEGRFELKLPENSTSGTYRLVYAVPQEEFYFDILYDGKEAVELSFDIELGLQFKKSEENIMRQAYFEEMGKLEEQLMMHYTSVQKSKKELRDIARQMRETQERFIQNSKGLIVHHFITANLPYIPKASESLQQYIENRRMHYFDAVDFDQPVLRASDFIKEKVLSFALTVHPLELKSSMGTQETIKNNLNIIAKKLSEVDTTYTITIFYHLWKELINHNLNSAADFLYNARLKELAKSTGNLAMIDEIELYNRLRLGGQAPEIVVQKGGVSYNLSDLKGDDAYILIFWSSTCSHCLNELPKLHAGLSEYTNIGVIAIGLEDEEENWKKESAKFPDFEHTIAFGKWENEYAKLYAIERTPTYFILDKNKKIISKPLDYQKVLEFLQK